MPSLDYGRDWQHVANWNTANLILASEGVDGQIYNVCSGQVVKLGHLINDIASALGVSWDPDQESTQLRDGDPLSSWGDNSKLRSLGWKQSKSYEQMVDDTIAWWHSELQ